MTPGRHIIARTRFPRAERGYAGVLTLYGFAYHLEVTRAAGDEIELVVYDGPAVGEYRIPLDGERGG